ncbi:MAG TPA: hypothetical protein VMT62_04440 [Syntrophorhabdaceae bacterium]|nr:hypothetical protein [Syntrophorhabdaceae bacterium]
MKEYNQQLTELRKLRQYPPPQYVGTSRKDLLSARSIFNDFLAIQKRSLWWAKDDPIITFYGYCENSNLASVYERAIEQTRRWARCTDEDGNVNAIDVPDTFIISVLAICKAWYTLREVLLLGSPETKKSILDDTSVTTALVNIAEKEAEKQRSLALAEEHKQVSSALSSELRQTKDSMDEHLQKEKAVRHDRALKGLTGRKKSTDKKHELFIEMRKIIQGRFPSYKPSRIAKYIDDYINRNKNNYIYGAPLLNAYGDQESGLRELIRKGRELRRQYKAGFTWNNIRTFF